MQANSNEFHSFLTQVYVKHLMISPVLLDSEHKSYIFFLVFGEGSNKTAPLVLMNKGSVKGFCTGSLKPNRAASEVSPVRALCLT